MTLGEVYSKIANHQIEGMMIHEQLANYYDFLGLCGYKRCHEYHFFAESCSFRSINRYFINHHNRLIVDEKVEAPKMIPDSWYKYTRQDVDTSTRLNAVKSATETWVEWETKTKALYQNMFKELMDMGEISAANMVNCLICDVDRELKEAERHHIKLKSVDYDSTFIEGEQKTLHNKYKKKLRDMGITLC